jgi:hypothetical protein
MTQLLITEMFFSYIDLGIVDLSKEECAFSVCHELTFAKNCSNFFPYMLFPFGRHGIANLDKSSHELNFAKKFSD